MIKHPKEIIISVKLNEQRTSLLGMFSISEYRDKTCFSYVERRNSRTKFKYLTLMNILIIKGPIH